MKEELDKLEKVIESLSPQALKISKERGILADLFQDEVETQVELQFSDLSSGVDTLLHDHGIQQIIAEVAKQSEDEEVITAALQSVDKISFVDVVDNLLPFEIQRLEAAIIHYYNVNIKR